MSRGKRPAAKKKAAARPAALSTKDDTQDSASVLPTLKPPPTTELLPEAIAGELSELGEISSLAYDPISRAFWAYTSRIDAARGRSIRLQRMVRGTNAVASMTYPLVAHHMVALSDGSCCVAVGPQDAPRARQLVRFDAGARVVEEHEFDGINSIAVVPFRSPTEDNRVREAVVCLSPMSAGSGAHFMLYVLCEGVMHWCAACVAGAGALSDREEFVLQCATRSDLPSELSGHGGAVLALCRTTDGSVQSLLDVLVPLETICAGPAPPARAPGVIELPQRYTWQSLMQLRADVNLSGVRAIVPCPGAANWEPWRSDAGPDGSRVYLSPAGAAHARVERGVFVLVMDSSLILCCRRLSLKASITSSHTAGGAYDIRTDSGGGSTIRDDITECGVDYLARWSTGAPVRGSGRLMAAAPRITSVAWHPEAHALIVISTYGVNRQRALLRVRVKGYAKWSMSRALPKNATSQGFRNRVRAIAHLYWLGARRDMPTSKAHKKPVNEAGAAVIAGTSAAARNLDVLIAWASLPLELLELVIACMWDAEQAAKGVLGN